jgi:hypothetical protein
MWLGRTRARMGPSGRLAVPTSNSIDLAPSPHMQSRLRSRLLLLALGRLATAVGEGVPARARVCSGYIATRAHVHAGMYVHGLNCLAYRLIDAAGTTCALRVASSLYAKVESHGAAPPAPPPAPAQRCAASRAPRRPPPASQGARFCSFARALLPCCALLQRTRTLGRSGRAGMRIPSIRTAARRAPGTAPHGKRGSLAA